MAARIVQFRRVKIERARKEGEALVACLELVDVSDDGGETILGRVGVSGVGPVIDLLPVITDSLGRETLRCVEEVALGALPADRRHPTGTNLEHATGRLH